MVQMCRKWRKADISLLAPASHDPWVQQFVIFIDHATSGSNACYLLLQLRMLELNKDSQFVVIYTALVHCFSSISTFTYTNMAIL